MLPTYSTALVAHGTALRRAAEAVRLDFGRAVGAVCAAAGHAMGHEGHET